MTTDRALGLRRAEAAARQLNKRYGVRSPADIRIEAFATAKGAKIVEGPLDGALARLVPGPVPIIRVSERLTDVRDRRWAIAHELGHLVLGHPVEQIARFCAHSQTYKVPRAGNERHPEAEANTFGAEALMPRADLVKPCDVARPSLDIAYWISETYTTPLAAAAIRQVEITSERCCALYSEGGRILWAVPSARFKPRVARGARLDPASVAYDYHARGKIDERAQPVSADAWLSTNREAEVVEHSVAIPATRGVLTLLWLPEAEAMRLKHAA